MFVAAVFALAAVPASADSYEPNDSAPAAYGPIVGGSAYNSNIGSSTDVDYYYFYANAPGTVRISFQNNSPEWYGCWKDAVALTAQGDLLSYVRTQGWLYQYNSDSDVLSFAVTGPAKVYLKVSGNTNGFCGSQSYTAYSFSVLPATLIAQNLPGASSAPPDCKAERATLARNTTAVKRLAKRLRHAHGKRRATLRKRLRKSRGDLDRQRKRVNQLCPK